MTRWRSRNRKRLKHGRIFSHQLLSGGGLHLPERHQNATNQNTPTKTKVAYKIPVHVPEERMTRDVSEAGLRMAAQALLGILGGVERG